MRPAIALALACVLAGCSALSSQPDPKTEEGKDSDIAASVAEALHAAEIQGWEKIEIAVENGVVTLRATDLPEATMVQASDLAQEIDGVKGVNVEIKPGPKK